MTSLAALGNRLYSGATSLPFIASRRIYYIIAVCVVLCSGIAVGVVGLNPGIDFKGGSEVTITDVAQPKEAPAREVLSSHGIDASAAQVTTTGSASVRVQTSELDKTELDSLSSDLASAYGVDSTDVSATTIGPTWSADVTTKAIRGLVIFFLLVGALIWAYFRTWTMAVAALLALCHDIILTVGVYALSGFEVTPATIIGVLTILGYSLYDTVVVFDKIRENTAHYESQTRATYAELVNLAVNQTFIRSINTSVVGVLPVASLLVVGAMILGAGTLRDIALTLFIGMIAGTLSSIFLAPGLLVDLRRREPAMRRQAEAVAKRRGQAGQGKQGTDGADGTESSVQAAAAAVTVGPLLPGRHLGHSAQPHKRKKRS